MATPAVTGMAIDDPSTGSGSARMATAATMPAAAGSSLQPRRGQSGAALLLMMLVVIVAAAAMLVARLNRNDWQQVESSATQAALAAAKAALLDYAGSSPDLVPGAAVQLPCPDLDNSGATRDGEAHTSSCGAAGSSMLGRLPWKTLGMPVPRDGSGECLWYVVSGEYKSAAAATSPMINPDSNGQLEIYQSETASIVAGLTPSSRPVALVIAPRAALPGQVRQLAPAPDRQCNDDFNAAAYLDSDAGSGISNANLAGGIAIEQFVRAAGVNSDLNDRILAIERAELAELVYGRHDYDARMRQLAAAVAQCVAAYGLSNPGGASDLRLPWPAPLSLGDYRLDANYDDTAGGVLSGRLADTVDDSSAATANTIARLLSDCNPLAVPAWSAAMRQTWANWKDHFFYYVAESFSPAAPTPSGCSNCLSVNGAGAYAAVVVFANRRLAGTAQVRDAPPLDADTRFDIANYLEGRNESGHPYSGGTVDLESQPQNASFNDIVYCIDAALGVSAC